MAHIVPVTPLTPEERQRIHDRWPKIVVDDEGYYTTLSGKRRSARGLLTLRAATTEDRERATLAIKEKSQFRHADYFALLEKGLQPAQACRKLGLSNVWASKMRRSDPDFAEKERDARVVATEKVVSAMFESALNGNFQAQNKILEQLDPETWRADKTIKIEQTTTHELNAGDAVARITALMATLEERRALTEGYIDVEVVD